MARSHDQPNHMSVFYSLAVLTGLEIGATFLPIAQLLIRIMLVGLAVTKVTLVALYFMHLKFERRTLTWIALTPGLICTFLVLMLLPDSVAVTRRPGSFAAAQETLPPVELIKGPGVDVVKRNCTRCHPVNIIAQTRKDRAGWLESIRWLQQEKGLRRFDQKTEETILDYLSTYYAPESSQ